MKKKKKTIFFLGMDVYLNVYDLDLELNGKLSWAGLGAFHSGVEVRPYFADFPRIKTLT